jgi:hypothetical protein
VNIGSFYQGQSLYAANGANALCAITNTGRLRCWGYFVTVPGTSRVGGLLSDMGDNLVDLKLYSNDFMVMRY